MNKFIKSIILIIICLGCNPLFSQSIEVIGGVNRNSFFYNNKSQSISTLYSPGYGYTVKIGVDDFKIDWLKLRFTLSYDNYSGKLEESYYGTSSSYKTIAEIEKSVISLGIFPLNFKIINRIDLNLGVELSRLINEKFEGTESGRAMFVPHWENTLQDEYERISSLNYSGFIGRIAYEFRVTENIIISPQYYFYYGISREFKELEAKSMRHFFSIGIEKKLK